MTTASFGGFYHGKRVLITGHTGFKGSWLCEWLLALGADVTGFSLPPPTEPALFEQLDLKRRISRHIEADINDLNALRCAVCESEPQVIIHMAAQALVRESYRSPAYTHATNIMGTVNILESVRDLNCRCAVVIVTSDKCYENREWLYGYRETDRLGGLDPYSASKAAAELVVNSYRHSFFQDGKHVRVATARAGNVIGGGDWATDRITPDCARALVSGDVIRLRNPRAVRPWQHVLEPLSGYLSLAAALLVDQRQEIASAFNFGPGYDGNRTVSDLVEEVLKHWPGQWRDESPPFAPHEAGLLQLNADKAKELLGWRPTWEFDQAVQETVRWYRAMTPHDSGVASLTATQIQRYTNAANALNIRWAAMGARVSAC